MGTTPIEHLRAWWAGITTTDPLKCAWCKVSGNTFKSEGGYRYCSETCEEADGADAWDNNP